MDREDIVAITDYLTRGVYPEGLTKGEKRSMRKRCSSFLCVDGVLYHRGKAGRRRLVVGDPAERRRIIGTMHEKPDGKAPHNGINITLRKVADWYWWRKITEDVRSFCRNCSECCHLFSTSRVDSALEIGDELKLRHEDTDPEPSFVRSVPVAEPKELNWTSYSSELLSALHQMYEQQICCDVILSAGGFQVSTHKVILTATSEYLKLLLSDHGSKDEVIQITDICGLCLEPIISFLYTGSLKLSQENVFLMMSTASQLGLTSAVSLCRQFLGFSDDNKVPDMKAQNEKPEDDCSAIMSSEKYLGINHAATLPKAAEFTDSVQDEIVILDIKEEIPSSSFLASEDLDALVPCDVPTRGWPNKKRRQKKCLRKGLPFSSDPSLVPNGRNVAFTDVHQKRYNTRSAAMQNTLLESSGAKFSTSGSTMSAKSKEVLKQRRRAMSRMLLETHGKRHLCYICESGFKFSSGLIHHLIQRHGILRLDLALFRLSRLSIRCAIEFGWHSKTANKSCQKSAISSSRSHKALRNSSISSSRCPITAEKRTHVRPRWSSRLYSAWCKLVKHEHQKCRLKKPSSGAVSTLAFRNRCGWCAKTFLRRVDLLEHRRQVHKRRKEIPPSGGVREKRVRNDWNCREKGCGVQLRTKETLRDHMATAHPTVFLSCPHCRYKTQVEHYLKRHLVRRHKDRYLCRICAKPYHKKFLLKVHMYNQHKIEDPTLQLHRCTHEGCGYACPGKSALQTHMQKHTVAKPFTCHMCGKDFKRALSLDKHINKIHLGIRPYICDKCGTSCCDEADLKRHLLKHEKNKTFTCSICSFSTFHRLVFQSHMFCRHQIVDEKMRLMKCDQCKFVTNKKYRYNDHVKMHKNIRDIPCPECGKSFVTQKTMRQHIVKVHKQTTQHCTYCPFKSLTVKKLQEHVSLMHTVPDSTPSSANTTRLSCGADAGVSSLVDVGSVSYPNVIPMALSNVVPSTCTDINLTLHSNVGPSSFPIVQSTLIANHCVSEFQEILHPVMNCNIANIHLPLDNGYCRYEPYNPNQSMR